MVSGKSRQQVAELLVRKGLQQEDFPAFGEHISEVMEVVDDDESSMQRITDVILRDVSLALKVLQTANSSYYNRSGKSLVSVSHAVTLLGLEPIRGLAGGMLLFEHFCGKSAGLKQTALLSLLTAFHARATARRIKYPNIEEAYLCGMFRNLGEILVSAYLPRKYAVILKRMKEFGVSEHDAGLRVLECTYEDLGQVATRIWKMPDRVRHCMRSEQLHVARTIAGELDVLRAIVSFGHSLTETVHRRYPGAERNRLNYFLKTYGQALSLNRVAIQEIAEEAVEQTKSTFDLLHIPLDAVRLQKQTETAMAALELEKHEGAEQQSGACLTPGEESLERLTERVELALCSGMSCDLDRMFRMILDAIFRGAPFDRVLFGLVSPDHRSVRGRLGLGDGIGPFMKSFQFPLSIRSGPLAVAMLGKRDVFVNDERYANTYFGQTVRSTNFGLLPVVVDNIPLGVLYVDRKSGDPAPSQEIIYQLSRLRSLATETIQISRKSAGGAT